jgi:hypothetical protein
MTPHGGIGAPLHDEQAISERNPFRARLTLAHDMSTGVAVERVIASEDDDERITSVAKLSIAGCSRWGTWQRPALRLWCC